MSKHTLMIDCDYLSRTPKYAIYLDYLDEKLLSFETSEHYKDLYLVNGEIMKKTEVITLIMNIVKGLNRDGKKIKYLREFFDTLDEKL